MYKLTKVEATDPKSKNAVVGQEWIGTYTEATLKVGKRLYFMHGHNYWWTSVIKNISDHPTDKNTVIIKTEYSVYHLTKIIDMISKGDRVQYIDVGYNDNRKTIKILKEGVWDGKKVVLNDKERTTIRNKEWLTKL